MAGYEPIYGSDDFGRPKFLSRVETDVRNVMFALFLKRGMYPSIPWMGGSIEDYLYKFVDDIDTNVILARLGAVSDDFLEMINNQELRVLKSTTSDGRPALLVRLPTIIQNQRSVVTVGITTDPNDKLVFNFEENDSPWTF